MHFLPIHLLREAGHRRSAHPVQRLELDVLPQRLVVRLPEKRLLQLLPSSSKVRWSAVALLFVVALEL